MTPAALSRHVRIVTDRISNPFGLSPPCEAFVPGFGDANADFHVIGDHPGVHGGVETDVPFTGRSWSDRFFEACADAGLVEGDPGDPSALDVRGTYFSYLHLCVPETDEPDEASYAALEPYFDAELRAITADVLLPVGNRATRHVLEEFTAQANRYADAVDDLHAREIRGSGWLVLPIREPAAWTDEDANRLVHAIRQIMESDYHQIADLGRFLPDDDPYFVR
jgi:uracil-DNA glycosylase